jgi:hypothetical protein
VNLTVRLLGSEILHITTEPDRSGDGLKDLPGGDFGFGRTDLTAIEDPEHRWETERPGWVK